MVNEKTNYVNGVTPSVARRIGKFAFGDNFIDMKVDQKEKTYLFLVKEKPDEDSITWWEFNWGANWKIHVVK